MNLVSYRTSHYQDSITRPANTSAYSIGDVLSDDDDSVFVLGTPVVEDGSRPPATNVNDPVMFPRASEDSRSVTIEKLTITSSANSTVGFPEIDLMIFIQDPGAIVDGTAFAISDADLIDPTKYAGKIPIDADLWSGLAPGGGAAGSASVEIDLSKQIVFNPDGAITGQLWFVPIMRNAYIPFNAEVWTVGITVTKDQ